MLRYPTLDLAQFRSSPVFPLALSGLLFLARFSPDRCFPNSQLRSVLVHPGIDGETSPTLLFPLFLRKEQGILAIRARDGQDQEGPNAPDI